MIKQKQKLCKCGCGKVGYIWSGGMLKECSYRIKKPKGLKKMSDKGKIKRELKKELVKTDMAFYFNLWQHNPHICAFCQVKLGDKPKLYYFDHILEKQAFPALRHKTDNIQFLCLQCHNNKTNGIVPKWFELAKAELKTKYKCDTTSEIPKQEDSLKDSTLQPL